jgi:secreted trypsin-like serine protease
MRIVVHLFAYTVLTSLFIEESQAVEVDPHIIGGTDASGLYSYFTLIDDTDATGTTCGGALIAEDYVLSAAQCLGLYRTATITVDASAGASAIPVTVISEIFHPMFDLATYANDILLLKLSAPVTGVTPITINTDATIPTVSWNVQS